MLTCRITANACARLDVCSFSSARSQAVRGTRVVRSAPPGGHDGGGSIRLRRRAPGARPECSVVVPVYNSQATLPTLIDRLAAVLPGVADRFEVVLVNDGSRDGSWEAIARRPGSTPGCAAST